MEVLGLLKIIGGLASLIGVLLFLRWVYKRGYEKGERKGEQNALIEAAKNNRELLKSLLAYVDEPNSAFRLSGKGDKDSSNRAP